MVHRGALKCQKMAEHGEILYEDNDAMVVLKFISASTGVVMAVVVVL